MDWNAWHHKYNTDTELNARLSQVKICIDEALRALPPGKVNVISLCSGDGRDLIELLPTHARRADVSGWLLECHESLVETAQQAIHQQGLKTTLHACVADATDARSYATIPPAHLIILAGVFGSVETDEIPRLLRNLQILCAPAAYVVWTQNLYTEEGQHRSVILRQALNTQSFTSVKLLTTPQQRYHIGLHQYHGKPVNLPLDDRLFTFGLRRYANHAA